MDNTRHRLELGWLGTPSIRGGDGWWTTHSGGGGVSEHRNKSRDVSQLGAMSQLHRSRKSPMKNEISCNLTESWPLFTQSFHFDSVVCTIDRTDSGDPILRRRKLGVRWLEDLPQSPWSLAHGVAMKPPVQLVREQTRTRESIIGAACGGHKSRIEVGTGEPLCRKLGSGFAGVPCP